MTAHDAPWYDRAACLGMAPLFDAEGDGRKGGGRNDRRKRKAVADRYEAAAKVCATCPVIAECARDARVGHDEGIRAGKVMPPLFSHERKAS